MVMAGVSVDVPEGVFSALNRTTEEFAREVRLAAIHWYGRGEVSQGRGPRSPA